MKTILYATDYSENSVSALRLAYSLAKKFSAKLIVMHVFDMPITLASTVTVTYLKKEKKLYVENRAKLKNFVDHYLDTIEMYMDLNFVVYEGTSVSSSIIEKAIKFNADLICVGAKGTSVIKELLLGSTANTLLKKSPCALLVVPTGSEKTELTKMVYATDFEQADIFAINKLAKIAHQFDAQIRVVHITTRNEYDGEGQMEWFKETLKQKVDYAKMEFDLVFSEKVFEDLLWYLENAQADLLVMLERKDSTFYQRYFQPDMVKQMVKNSPVPLLSFNAGGL
ncbi:Nucleotide-binding universal stress protein, UspA family [Maribacter orientalis]|uniref:Nucleotide-binding universal stress protein, UspA family n=1 Tax=Maribacter orientalis TaxID=228957 RepID=A0A1H7NXH8_9FLAO|nr:universal stress protein [Maribacter orientalis]SEL28019.1 Nucleotide-binding universal stress protein, UspA family [Maribacter orientalis]